MNVTNKVLVVLVAILAIVFTIFAANRYQLAKDQDTKIANLEKDLQGARDSVASLKAEIYDASTSDAPQTLQGMGLDSQLKYVRGLQNGEDFRDCQNVETSVSEENSGANVSIVLNERYQLSSFRNNAFVYLFDSGLNFVADASEADATETESAGDESESADAPAGAGADAVATIARFSFLGAFKVIGTVENNRQVKLQSIGFMSDDELAALEQSKRSGHSLVAYVDSLPIDSPADVQSFAQFYPEFNDVLSAAGADDNRKFINQGLGMTFSAVSSKAAAKATDSDDEDAAASDEDAEEEVAAAPTTNPNGSVFALDDENRAPVDFQGALERMWIQRDKANVFQAKLKSGIALMTNVVANQFVLIGEQLDADALAKAENFGDWEDVYKAAQGKKSVDSYSEMLAKRKAELASMEKQRDLVKKLVAIAQDSVKELKNAQNAAIQYNAQFAKVVAELQFKALQKLEKEAAAQTAAADSNFSLNDI